MNVRYWGHVTPDGLPIPPSWLIVQVAGAASIPWFLEGGKMAFADILSTLKRNGIDVNSLRSILDFGCGCGRVTRYWKGKGTRVFGTDYNPSLIRWCRKNIPYAKFETNRLTPPTVYGTGEFDLVYAVSVFTHLTERDQISWMHELSRILRPGGYLLITTHGESLIGGLSDVDQGSFRMGRLVVKHREASGTNLCGAYHPQEYVRETLADGFCVSDFVPQGLQRYQDIYLLKKIKDNRNMSD
jgi:SAM-dependent methyltransferase